MKKKFRLRRGGSEAQRIAAIVTIIAVVAMVARLATGMRQGLDVDEVFSLAMATGHSVEQPASVTRAELGDFIPAPKPQAARSYLRYVTHEASPAGIPRVVRAVFLSDTNPPLYYIALNFWTRLGGTSDLSLRMFSILLSTACVPLVFLLGSRLYGRNTGYVAALMFALAPQSVFYGSLGRMYPMLAILVISVALLTLRARSRPRWTTMALWIAVSAAGLLTHYFFAFAWLGICAWIAIYPHRLSRLKVPMSMALAVALVAPWYMRVPETLAGWRVTKGWLDTAPAGFNPVVAQARMLAGWFMTAGDWMNRHGITDWLLILFIAGAVVTSVVVSRRMLALRATHLLLIWIAASSFGLLVFDVIQHTYARQHSRYAFAALPAALILLAAFVARLPFRIRVVSLAAIVGLWVSGLMRLNRETSGDNPFRTVASLIRDEGIEDRVVVVHAIPTGVIGIARYVDPNTMMLDWVEALETRTVEKDAAAVAAAASLVTLVKSPPIGVVPEEEYFGTVSSSIARRKARGYEKLEFVIAR